ncbi:DUF3422 domain-containing protein [Roseovarius faecimaris]|uniref:DUF3422 domain-containing protein n=1 Tax=Roseovarius faecimaris TaxID=2494550 RepID=A0A6I6IUG7_9RHOB|nr:DUF3422 domain-containing protein [Roseovarius faecimaris]QGX99006.1 DUF3422 domain-containing protein [Roseovarius faecimaris]
MPPIADHPLRYDLVNELHARPFPVLSAPSTAVFLAVKRESDAAGRDPAADIAHLTALLDRHGAPHPQPGATHYFGQIGRHHLKWEQHTEMVTYTVFTEGLSDRAFDPADFDVLPEDWLEAAPGARMTSALIRIAPWESDDVVRDMLHTCFVPESVAVARVLDDAAIMAGDFRIDTAGHIRFALFVKPQTGPRRIGRIVQRMCEIESYKTMSMLGFAKARGLSPEMRGIDERLGALIGGLSGDGGRPAEEALHSLLAVSSELEAMVARSSFRMTATMAYETIVDERIRLLREERFEGRQTFAEFMTRRFQPAMRTVRATKARMEAMAERASRAGDLLRTRVDVERSAQNQALLESMNQRADLQLRLQKTVEGLSVVAISYYAVSLAGYLLYPLAGALGISKGMLLAGVTLPVVLLVWWMVNNIRKRLH